MSRPRPNTVVRLGRNPEFHQEHSPMEPGTAPDASILPQSADNFFIFRICPEKMTDRGKIFVEGANRILLLGFLPRKKFERKLSSSYVPKWVVVRSWQALYAVISWIG